MENNLKILLIYFFSLIHSSVLLVQPFDYVKNIFNYYRSYPPFPDLFSTNNPRISSSYDFIVIGAGSAGSVLANRLTEVEKWNVLLLEAGKEEIFLTDWPLLAAAMQITSYNWGYKTQPSYKKRKFNKKSIGGYCLSMTDGRCNWPRGKAVGGTSVINFMIHSRGGKKDFDRWEADGNKGWSYKDVLPYFLKSESLNINEHKNNKLLMKGINKTIHGTNGYLDVTFAPWTSPLQDKFLQAGIELGYNVKDCNDANPIGFCPAQVNLRHGRRVSASKSYLRPIRHRQNFHLLKESFVTQIVIDPKTKTAIGVKFVNNGKSYYVKAKKEVILSAGSINSPQILMLSGIGPKDHLQNYGINVIENLPVGFNLQDHVSMAALTFLVNDTVTIVESRVASNFKNTFDYLAYGTGPFTVPSGAEALAFLNTKKNYSNSNSQMYDPITSFSNDDDPDIELVFGIGSLAGDLSGVLRSIFNLPDKWYNEVFGDYVGRDAFSIVPILLHPKSRGRISLQNSNPFHSPVLEANYFEDEEDLKTLVRGIKKAIQVASTRAFSVYNATLLPVKFPGCKQWDFNSDNYWSCVCRQISTTLGHFIGTCKMAPRQSGGVVDNNLKVYGVNRLRVVDASIIPSLIAGHTNAPTYMIGEKVSDLIKYEWRGI